MQARKQRKMCAEHWKLLYSARDISEDFVKDSESKICRVEVGLAGTGSPCSVCAVDLGVDGAVVVPQAEDSVSCIRQDRGERVGPGPWTVKHLGLQLAKLVLQVGKLVGKGLDDRWVPCSEGCLIRGPEVLGSRVVSMGGRLTHAWSIEKIIQGEINWFQPISPQRMLTRLSWDPEWFLWEG